MIPNAYVLFMRTVCSILTLMTVACTAPTVDLWRVALLPARSGYAPGETVTATLINASEEPIGYGGCSLRLERRVRDGWQLIGPEELACYDILYVLEAGRAREFESQLSPDIESGLYRLHLRIMPRARLPAARVYSSAFRVQPGIGQ